MQSFFKAMDAFATAMRDLSIENYTTKNTIGATEVKVTYTGGYGTYAYKTTERKKDTINMIDILNGKSIKDNQNNKEFWRDLFIGIGLIVGTVALPPVPLRRLLSLPSKCNLWDLGTKISSIRERLDDRKRNGHRGTMAGAFSLLDLVPEVKR